MYNKLLAIQSELKVPKSRRNSFGNYNYRSCEDIVEAVKPLCQKHGVTLTLSDEVVDIGGRVFVCARAILNNNEPTKLTQQQSSSDWQYSTADREFVVTTGYAEIAPEKKGMDVAQITGAASSYARKYALNGLFAIDDVADADATNTHGKKADYPKPPEGDEINLD